MVTNPQSGTGKTVVSLTLAATFGRLRKVPVLAWDLSGTHRTRGGSADPPDADFDVLSADDLLAARLTSSKSYVSLSRRLAQDYDVLLLDTGNDVTAPGWRAASSIADHLVVPTTLRPEGVDAGLRTLKYLAPLNLSSAARSAIAVICCTDPDTGSDTVERIAERYRPYVRDVVVIPFDESLRGGETVAYDELGAPAQGAYLELAAAVVRASHTD
ncbi:MinD/ParA family protein [Micromonospora sp. NPDC050397]|uniref:MinD/ParA family ATP-binding protein n=1 Tax=Micromonospora sp. NPDC050397 TaxID=3364279 RepID=UPI00384DC05D